MTDEKAKELLNNLIGMVEDNHESDYDTALSMAIETLENQKTLQEELEKIKSDIRELSYNGEICTIDRYRVEEVINKHIKENE